MLKKKTLLLRVNVNDYFIPYCRKKICFEPVYYCRMERVLFRIHEKLSLLTTLGLFGWKRKIRDYDRIILFDYGWSSEITAFIRRMNPRCSIHLFLFNTIVNEDHFKILHDNNIDKLWSFDSGDVNKYNISFNTPMYSREVPASMDMTKQPQYDIVFVGSAKQRKQEIMSFYDECRKRKISFDLNIINDKSEYISYSEYLQRISQSRCILDITNEGQRGLTLRFMEAIFLSKKIITNNNEVKNYPFYCKSNVFILGEDDMDDLKTFLESNYSYLDNDIVDYYDIENWIERFN